MRDAKSVQIARDIVDQLMKCLLNFDFRNGHLRRKYDGVKYALKRLETLLYELAVTKARIPEESEPDPKRSKIENDIPVQRICVEEIRAIRENMEKFDECREIIIKRCRDSQKAAKQAIFALHRGDFQGASKLLGKCEAVID